jgi:hypothetical protein
VVGKRLIRRLFFRLLKMISIVLLLSFFIAFCVAASEAPTSAPTGTDPVTGRQFFFMIIIIVLNFYQIFLHNTIGCPATFPPIDRIPISAEALTNCMIEGSTVLKLVSNECLIWNCLKNNLPTVTWRRQRFYAFNYH